MVKDVLPDPANRRERHEHDGQSGAVAVREAVVKAVTPIRPECSAGVESGHGRKELSFEPNILAIWNVHDFVAK